MTFVLTGIIVVLAVLLDIIKNKNAAKVKIETEAQKFKRLAKEHIAELNDKIDILTAKNNDMPPAEKAKALEETQKELAEYKLKWKQEYQQIKAGAKR